MSAARPCRAALLRPLTVRVLLRFIACWCPSVGAAAEATLGSRVELSVPPGPLLAPETLQLSGAGAGEVIRYELQEPSGAGAGVDDPTTASPEYAAPIVLDRPYVLRAAVFTADGTQHGPVTHAHYLPLARDGADRLDTFTSPLPIVVIDLHGFGPLVKDEIDHAGWLYAFARGADGLAQIGASPAVALPLEITVRGTSSATFPKKGYKFELQNAQGKKQPVPLLGLGAFAEWNLVGPWRFDRTYVRNAFGYTLSRQLGRWAARTQLAEVFINADGDPLDAADYAGVYVLTDKLEAAPGRIDVTEVKRDDVDPAGITGGYLLRVDDFDPEKTSWRTQRGFPSEASRSLLMVESPKTAKLAPAQAAYIKGYVQAFEDALYADRDSGWRTRRHLEYIDRDTWVDHHLLNTLLKNTDAFTRSAYYSKDRGGRLLAGPIWDLDRAMGAEDPRGGSPEAWDAADVPDWGFQIKYWEFGWWGVLAGDPDFRQAWIDRWQGLRRGPLSDAGLTALVDQLAGEIGLEAAERDRRRWAGNIGTHASYAGEVAELKAWLVTRARWIDRQFVPAPSVTLTGDMLMLTPAVGTELIYVTGDGDPRGADGEPRTDAQRSREPVSLPRDAVVSARAYRPAGSWFPATSWSAPAPHPDELSPTPGSGARLANLSARGTAQADENTLIAGVVVRADTPKPFLVRAVGPTLAELDVETPLPDPVLRLMDAAGAERARNAGWSRGTAPRAIAEAAAAVGAFALPEGSRDAALLVTLPGGVQSLLVSSASRRMGDGLVELYETDDHGIAVNLSARALVQPARPLIGGFVITGNAPKRVLVRAVGPTLASQGVLTPLADPQLTVYALRTRIAENDNWAAPADAALLAEMAERVGAFALPAGSRDAALLLSLRPGIYTAVVTSRDATEGIALVELYDAD